MAKQVNRSRTRYRRLVNCLVTSASVIARVIAGHARSLARANEWNPRAWDKRLLIGGCAARRIRIWIKNALITTGWPDFSFCLSKGERERDGVTRERIFIHERHNNIRYILFQSAQLKTLDIFSIFRVFLWKQRYNLRCPQFATMNNERVYSPLIKKSAFTFLYRAAEIDSPHARTGEGGKSAFTSVYSSLVFVFCISVENAKVTGWLIFLLIQ